jgi:hypothetical protein
MDEQRVDRFARWLSAQTSRRNLFRIAAGAAAAWLSGTGRPRVARAQVLKPPLPNFPFLPVLPTDAGFTSYQLDRLTGGGPRLFTALTAPGFVAPSLQKAFSTDVRGGYASTIVLPSKTDPKTADEAVTTTVFDCGNTSKAKRVFTDFSAAMATLAGVSELPGIKPIGKDSVILGCDGLCESAIGDPYSGEPNVTGVISLSYRGRLVTEVHLRNFTGKAVTGAEARAAGKLVDLRVKDVESVALATGPLRALVAAPAETGQTDADAPATSPFAAYNTTPVFSFSGEAPEVSAQAFLRVMDGTAIPWAPPLDTSNAIRQNEATRDGISDLIHVEQTFSTAAPYRSDYALVTYHEQFVFPTADLRDAYFSTYREKAAQDLPGITFTDVNVTGSQLMYAFTALISDALGTWSGFETFAKVDSPLGFAMFDVSLVAVPNDPSTPPPPVDAVISELGAAVFEMQAAIMTCLRTPESCPQTVTILANPTIAQTTGATGFANRDSSVAEIVIAETDPLDSESHPDAPKG